MQIQVALYINEQIVSYRHPLFFSSTENIHPVLHTIPASLTVQNLSQLNIIKVIL